METALEIQYGKMYAEAMQRYIETDTQVTENIESIMN